MIFLITKGKLKNIVRMAEKLGWNNGLKEGYGNGHTRGYKEGFETGRLYERSPELFGMNYFTYLREIEPPPRRLSLSVAGGDDYNDIEAIIREIAERSGWAIDWTIKCTKKPKTDIPQAFKEAFDE